jgi:hypothetical protein
MIMDANFDPDSPESSHDRFLFGLGCLLDGFAAAIAAASGNRPQTGESGR